MPDLFDQFIEERYCNPAYPEDGTYLHPFEHCFMRNGEYVIALTDNGKVFMQMIKRQLFKEN